MKLEKMLLVLLILAVPVMSAELNCNPLDQSQTTTTWVINEDVRCENRQIYVPYDTEIVVNNSHKLELHNIDLQFNGSNSFDYQITLNADSVLVLNETNISLYNPSAYGYRGARITGTNAEFNMIRSIINNAGELTFHSCNDSSIIKSVLRDNEYDSCYGGDNNKAQHMVSLDVDRNSRGWTVDGLSFENVSVRSHAMWYMPSWSLITNISVDKASTENCYTNGGGWWIGVDQATTNNLLITNLNIESNYSNTSQTRGHGGIIIGNNAVDFYNVTLDGYVFDGFIKYGYPMRTYGGANAGDINVRNVNITIRKNTSRGMTQPFYAYYDATYDNYAVHVDNFSWIDTPDRFFFIYGTVSGGYGIFRNITLSGDIPENVSDFSTQTYSYGDFYNYYQPVIVDENLDPVEGVELHVTNDAGETPILTTNANGYPDGTEEALVKYYTKNSTGTYYYNASADVYVGGDYIGSIPANWSDYQFSFTQYQFTVPSGGGSALTGMALQVSESSKTLIWMMIFLMPIMVVGAYIKGMTSGLNAYDIALIVIYTVVMVAVASIL